MPATDTGSLMLRAILADPACDTARLVYADFLEDNGEPERAEFIRVQCELAGLVVRPVAHVYVGKGDPCGPVAVEGCLGSDPTGVVPGAVVDWTAEFVGSAEPGRVTGVGTVSSLGQDRHGLRVTIRPLVGCRQDAERGQLAALRRRERDVWKTPEAGGWFGDECYVTIGRSVLERAGDGRKPSGLIRRGFVSEVRCDFATLFGGRCRQCHGAKRVPVDRPNGLLRRTPDVSRVCPECAGTGRTPGFAAALFARHPVTAVTLSDVTAVTYASENGWLVGWPRDTLIVTDVSNACAGGHPTSESALAAVSAAVVAWGRREAGLPPLGTEPGTEPAPGMPTRGEPRPPVTGALV